MATIGDCILVCLVGQDRVGRKFARRRNNWPYHVTLVPWFHTVDEAELDAALESYAHDSTPFEAVIGPEQSFGEHGEVHVNSIARPGQFHELHLSLLTAVKSVQASGYDTRWLGERYNPHVTRHYDGKEGCKEGFTFRVEGFYKVRLLENNVCVIDSYYAFGRKI